jgi:hypothetical protein
MLAVLAAALCSAHGQSSQINPSQDTFVDSAEPNYNYGHAGALAIAAAGLPQGQFDSVIMFNFASTEAGFNSQYGAGQWAVQSVTLTLNSFPPGNPIFNGFTSGEVNTAGLFSVNWMQNDTWVEGTGKPSNPTTDGLTWNTLPAYSSASDESLGTFSFDGSVNEEDTYTLALTPGLLSDIQNGNNSSMNLFAADSNIAYVFNSLNGESEGYPAPLLTVNAIPTPEPSAFALVAAATTVLIGRRARRR